MCVCECVSGRKLQFSFYEALSSPTANLPLPLASSFALLLLACDRAPRTHTTRGPQLSAIMFINEVCQQRNATAFVGN